MKEWLNGFNKSDKKNSHNVKKSLLSGDEIAQNLNITKSVQWERIFNFNDFEMSLSKQNKVIVIIINAQ